MSADPLFWIGSQEGASFQLFSPENPFLQIAENLRGPIIATAASYVAMSILKQTVYTNIFILTSTHLVTRIAKKLFDRYPITSLLEKGALEVYRQLPYVFLVAMIILATVSQVMPLLTLVIACTSGILSGLVIDVYRSYARILQHVVA